MKKAITVLLILAIFVTGCATPATSSTTPQPQRVPTPVEVIVPTGTPMPPQEAKKMLEEWGLTETDEIHVLQIGTPILQAGIEGACNPDNAYLFWQHIAVNHLREFPEEAAVAILDGLASGTLQPDKIVGNGGRAVIKLSTMGQKWLLVVGKAVKPTLYTVTDARYIASMIRGTKVSAKPLAEIAVCLKAAYEVWVRNGRPHDPDTPVRRVAPVSVKLPTPDPANLPTVTPMKFTTITINSQSQQVYFLDEVNISSEEAVFLIGLGVVIVVGVISAGGGGYILALAVL